MDRVRHKRNYDLHSWTGVALGFFLFVVCFTGSVALFYNEILSWEDPNKRITLPAEPAAFNETFTEWHAELEASGEVEYLNVYFPRLHAPYYAAYAHVDLPDGSHVDHSVQWHPETLEMLPERADGMARWLYDFHRDLMWPAKLGGRTVGRALVGVAGVILLLAIVSGVIAHTKIREELFTLRYMRSMRLKWQDTHKVLGLWGLPFYSMIALTGAVLGIVTLLAPIIAILAFKGDQQALFDAVIGQPPEPVGQQVQMMSVDDIYAMPHPESGERPWYVATHNWGDEAAVLDIYYKEDRKLISAEGRTVSAVTGEPAYSATTDTKTPGNRLVAAMSPLHYGTFGGIALKALYFVLGLSLAVITALGTMMWIERRLHGNEGAKSERFYRRLSRFNVGICAGIGFASAGLLVHGVLYAGAESSRLFWTGTAYFALWFAALAYAMVRKDEYRTTSELVGLSGILLLTASVLNMVTTGHGIAHGLFGDGHAPTAWVDVTLIGLGAASIAVALALPKKRAEKTKRRRESTAEVVPAE
ncbi:MAG: PepSY-associated TM helix domain-containing protein [Pseudomonadota bacterium]